MSYYIRYVLTEDHGVTLTELEQALHTVAPTSSIENDLILLGDEAYGQIDITYRGDPICDEDLELLSRFAREKQNRDAILESLRNAKSMVTVQPIWSGDEETVSKVLDPLWEWLLANRAGILAVEGGYFYNQAGALN